MDRYITRAVAGPTHDNKAKEDDEVHTSEVVDKSGDEMDSEAASGKCNSVWKPYAKLVGTSLAFASAFKHSQMVPASVSNGSGLSLWGRIGVQYEPLPNCRSG
jgi:hypothetical protein